MAPNQGTAVFRAGDSDRGVLPRPGPATQDPGLAAAVRVAARYADDAERDRAITSATADALTSAGLPRYFVPRLWGGTDGSFTELLAALTALAGGCASAAWCGGLFAAHSRFAAYLPARGQRDLWDGTPDVRIAAAVKPSGRAVPAPGGWELTGEWACVSAVRHAHWALLCAPAGEGGEPTMFAVERARLTVEDTWRAPGMRGTGSHTARVSRAPVPAHRTFPLAELMAGAHGFGRGPRHTVPARLAGGLLFCAPALGAAHRALDTWARWAAPHAARAADGAPQRTLADAASAIEAAQLLLTEAARRADAPGPTEADVLDNQRAATAAAGLLVRGVRRLTEAEGPAADDEAGQVLDRCLRDVRTVASHAVLRPEPAALVYGDGVFAALAGPPHVRAPEVRVARGAHARPRGRAPHA